MIYLTCASQFGWDKEQVDKQPFKYLKNILLMLKEEKLKSVGIRPKGKPIGDQKDLSKYPKPTLPKIKPKPVRRKSRRSR